mgnify:CR=1 FL=1
MKNKHLEKLKQQYEEQETAPSSSVWETLEQRLSEENHIHVIQKKKSEAWLKYAAVLLLLLGTTVIVWMNDGNEKNVSRKQNPLIVQNSVKIMVPEKMNTQITISEVRKSPPEFHKKVEKTAPVSLSENTRIKTETTPEPTMDIVQNPEPQHIAVVPNEEVISEQPEKKYIKANDLLFSRKLEKTKNHDHENDRRMGVRRNNIKPDFFSVLGARIDNGE